MALNIRCEDYFAKVKAEAEERGILDKLQEKLDWLENYGGESGTAELYHDFAPLSFGFCVQLKGGCVIHGGVIFYEGAESGVTGQLSVTLSNRTDSRWEIHT